MVYNLTKIATPFDNRSPESRSVLATYTYPEDSYATLHIKVMKQPFC